MEDKAEPGEGRERVERGQGVKGFRDAKGVKGVDGVEGAHRREPALTGHDIPAGPAGRPEPAVPHETGRSASAGSVRETPLLPHEETDTFSVRLQHAVGEFVDGPRDAVEEADHVLEELASRFTDAVTQRRRTLRMAWQSTGDGKAAEMDTEQLRLALRDYRELTERLLRT